MPTSCSHRFARPLLILLLALSLTGCSAGRVLPGSDADASSASPETGTTTTVAEATTTAASETTATAGEERDAGDTFRCLLHFVDAYTGEALPASAGISGPEVALQASFSEKVDRSSLDWSLDGFESAVSREEWKDDKTWTLRLSGMETGMSGTVTVTSCKPADGMGELEDISDESTGNVVSLSFRITPEQRLRAIGLNGGSEAVLHVFRQGVFANGCTPDGTRIALGLVTAAEDGWIYRPMIFETSSLSVVQPAAAQTLYNPLVEGYLWSSDNQYRPEETAVWLAQHPSVKARYDFIVAEDGSETPPELRLAEALTDPDGGLYAAESDPAVDSAPITLRHFDASGAMDAEIPLPARISTSDGWFASDLRMMWVTDSLIWLCGKASDDPVNEGDYADAFRQTSWLLNIRSGEISKVASGFHPHAEIPVWGGYVHLERDNAVDAAEHPLTVGFSAFEGGEDCEVVIPESDTFDNALYNPVDRLIYVLYWHSDGGAGASKEDSELRWKTLNPETGAVTEGSAGSPGAVSTIGFSPNGELYVLEDCTDLQP